MHGKKADALQRRPFVSTGRSGLFERDERARPGARISTAQHGVHIAAVEERQTPDEAAVIGRGETVIGTVLIRLQVEAMTDQERNRRRGSGSVRCLQNGRQTERGRWSVQTVD